MIALVQLLVFTVAILFTAASSGLLTWLILRGAFYLMRPAAVRITQKAHAAVSPMHLVPGTIEVMRAYSARR
jgi:hypothetical protein